MHREEKGAGHIGFSERDFKVCGLCGALNRVDNDACFICGWAGIFHYDPDTVRQVIREFEQERGGLTETLLSEEILPNESPGPGFLSTLIEKIKVFLSGR